MIFLMLFFVPLVVAAVAYFLSKGKITIKELIVQLVIQALVVGCSIAIIYSSNTYDTEVWNGRITKKESERIHCRHSYECHCHTVCTGSGKKKSCSRVCQTCYEHSYDMEWYLKTSNNETIEIDTIDRQGLRTPPRWHSAKIGDPSSMKHSYTNYIKAAPDTLFRHQGLTEKFKESIPQYPDNIYDLHRLNRVITLGVNLPDIKEWNQELSEINADLGASKQVNTILVIASGLPQEYFYALEQAWIGGKKNDVVVVIGVTPNNQFWDINWVSVAAWTKEEIFKIRLRDDILSTKTMQRNLILKYINDNVSTYYVRKPMKDFEYLKSSITPTPTEWLVALLISFLTSIGLSILFWKVDLKLQ